MMTEEFLMDDYDKIEMQNELEELIDIGRY